MLNNFLSDASNIQIYNTILNTAGLILIAVTAATMWGYKRRVSERYDYINNRLDHILLLAYQQAKVNDQKEILATTIPRATGKKGVGGS